MKCEKCGKNNANVKIIKELNNKKEEIMLCERCAKEIEDFIVQAELDDVVNYNLSDILTNLVSYINSDFENEGMKICTICGTTYDELKKDGQVGCINCYTVFGEEIEKVLKVIQGTEDNNSRKYKYLDGYKNNMKLLEEELKVAISYEEYEKAIVIRDLLVGIKLNKEKS